MEDDFELQRNWHPGLDILASLVPEACAATLAHSSMTWTLTA